jgi:predicted ABC-type transport system involved in lysophospholipase L1 biosynthesis ATPase subunit
MSAVTEAERRIAPATVAESIVEARGVDKAYDTGTVEVRALRDVTLTVDRGEMVAIMGQAAQGRPRCSTARSIPRKLSDTSSRGY